MKKVAVIGEGAWGSAIAMLLSDNGFKVNLWCQDPSVAQTISEKRKNERYFPSYALPASIIPVTDFAAALDGVTYIFEAIPVKYLRTVFTTMRPHIRKDHVVIILSKGIENNTLLFPSALVQEVLGFPVEHAVLAGPNFANEIAEQRVTAATLASPSCDRAIEIQHLLANNYFRPYITTDTIGTQVGAALKNVISLGIGMAEGAGLSENTKAFLLTRGLAEMAQVAVALGGRKETVYGLSGVGDLVLSSMGTQGRNVSLGRELGQGKTLAELERVIDVLPESVNTVKSLHQMIKQKNLDLPVCQGIYQAVYEKRKMTGVVAALMARPLEYECEVP
jgi:glycerol-3-phosphate dehydrogenase (NAD(P)+)